MIIILVLLMVLVVQIIGFSFFNRKLYDMSLEHSMSQVEELSIYVEKNLEVELEWHLNTLFVIESQLENQELLFSSEVIKQLAEAQKNSKFSLMGLSDLSGEGVDSTGEKYDIQYDHIREHIERGEVFISNVWQKRDETLIFMAVPLKVNGEILGILWGKYPLRNLVEQVNVSIDEYKYFQIVDDQGHYLMPSNSRFALNKSDKLSGTTIWEEMESYRYPDGPTPREIRERVRRGESGTFYFEDDGQGRYVNYRPLSINSWYLFSVQVDEGLHSFVQRTRGYSLNFFTILTIGLLIIFGIIYHLIYSMYRRIVAQSQKIQALNIMFRSTLEQTRNVPFTIDYPQQEVALYGYPTKDQTERCSFQHICPENLLQKQLLAPDSLEEYTWLYQRMIIQREPCEPVIVCLRLGEEWKWKRVSILTDIQTGSEHLAGVLEDYDEQKAKDLKIETHLDDIKKIEEKSYIDFLTKCYNREGFLEKLKAAMEEERQERHRSALLILDLDHFKAVNDCMGHGMGDVVLQEMAEKLTGFFRTADLVGRFGGDEFMVFARNIRDIPAFERRIQRLNKLLCQTYRREGQQVEVSASIGVVYTGTEPTDFQTLYERADQALYQVKECGHNGYRVYQAQIKR